MICIQSVNWPVFILHLPVVDTEALVGASFGEGIGRIWLDNVQCTGTERSLINCVANSSGVNSCTHAQDVGVRCEPGNEYIGGTNSWPLFAGLFAIPGCTEGDARLVGGNNHREGRVEVCRSNTWGTSVCRNGWSVPESMVVCRELGLSTIGKILHSYKWINCNTISHSFA